MYHVWWPYPSDPFYGFDPYAVQARVNFYDPPGITYTPSFRYDGKKISDLFGTQPNYPEFFTWLDQAVDSLGAIPSPIRIDITDQYVSSDSDTVYVSFDVVAEDTIIYEPTPVVWMAATQEHYAYPFIGNNIDSTGKYVFRDMEPQSGQIISIQKGDSLHFDWAYPYTAPPYVAGDMITAIWVQNEVDMGIPGKWRNKVLQATSSPVVSRASVPGGPEVPGRVWLGQNTPNPFRSGTTIAFTVGRPGAVRLAVYSATGQLVANLLDGPVEAGSHTASWNGLDRFGRSVGSGMYYYRLDTADGSRSGKMVFLK
ncbi:MAG TPA: T9SS type A sorting domain-containing protein [bacterium]|nr:T9SS type A sorting domain-containing protein [bacterium]